MEIDDPELDPFLTRRRGLAPAILQTVEATDQLSFGEQLVGLIGVATRRLDGQRRVHRAKERVEDLRGVLGRLGDYDALVDTATVAVPVADGYARWSSTYDLPGNVLIDVEQPVVWHLLADCPPGPALDAGCGTGRHLAHLLESGRPAIGVDATPEMLERARAKWPGADLRVGQLEALPLGDGEVSVVVCALSLDHVAELDGPFEEFARVLGRGGQVIVSTLHPVMHNVLGWGAWFIDTDGRRGAIGTYEHWHADFLRAAKAGGLRLVDCIEPTITAEMARRFGGTAHELDVAMEDCYAGLPLVLILRFEKG